MTEQDWLAATDPKPMLAVLQAEASDRKLRLFAVACCQSVWMRLPISIRAALRSVEQFADGQATLEEFSVNVVSLANEQQGALIRALAYLPGSIWNPHHAHAVETLAFLCARASVHSSPPPPRWHPDGRLITADEEKNQANRLRDIFGQPFRPVTADPSWLTSDVVALAEGIYQDKAFDRLQILADALQDAGCENEDILDHCRSEGPHVRGCWVIDLLTGRK